MFPVASYVPETVCACTKGLCLPDHSVRFAGLFEHMVNNNRVGYRTLNTVSSLSEYMAHNIGVRYRTLNTHSWNLFGILVEEPQLPVPEVFDHTYMARYDV